MTYRIAGSRHDTAATAQWQKFWKPFHQIKCLLAQVEILKTYVDGHGKLRTEALTQRLQKPVRKVTETCLAKEVKVFGTVKNGNVFSSSHTPL